MKFSILLELANTWELLKKWNIVYVRPTVCVSGGWAGVDSVWEQEKPEARKLLFEAAESHPSDARFVRWLRVVQDLFAEKQNHAFNWLDFTRTPIFYKPNFVLEIMIDLPKR